MNYFERLVRRGLMQPASKPGGALVDPFENVDDWPLEAIAAALEQHDAPPVSVAPLHVETLPPHTLEDERTTVEVLPSEATGVAPPVFTATPIDSAAREVPRDAPAPDSPRVEVLPPVPESPPLPALEMADQFMRTLGVPVPERAPHTQIAPPATAFAPAGTPQSIEAAAVQVRTQIVSPPPPPRPELPAAPESPATPDAEPARAQTPDGERESQRRAPTIVETRRVIVVDRQSGGRVNDTIASAGSPRFGLGQL